MTGSLSPATHFVLPPVKAGVYFRTMRNIKEKISKLTSQVANLDPMDFSVEKPRSDYGDYAVNAAFVLAKRSQKSPNEIAGDIVEKLNTNKPEEFEKIEAVGGYVNFFLSKKYLKDELNEILKKGEKYGSGKPSEKIDKKPIIVEYFQNNVAKPPHIGHLRSAVLGDSLLRVFKFLGYKTISDTHIGDWGTQFGILIYAYKEFIKNGGKKSDIEKDPINELNKLYVDISNKIEKNPELKESGKIEFKKLEDGDGENRKLWQWFVDESKNDFENYRKQLDLLPFDHNFGESFYEDKMESVFGDLKKSGLVIESDGAQIINLEEDGLGIAILKKSDGASTYLLRDLATFVYRVNEFNFYKNLYVVDVRQSHHFEQLFNIAVKMDWDKNPDKTPRNISRHVVFGFMSFEGNAISTRKGNAATLQDVLDEAQKRALEIIKEKNPGLEDKEKAARLIGLAALKYFDLSHNRKTEFNFDWEKALSFEGDTGPYLQYAHTRIHGILRKTNKEIVDKIVYGGEINKHESNLMRKLVQFPDVVEEIIYDYTPNILCHYLFELSQTFNSFYEAARVLQETDKNRRSFRLAIITATAQIIKNGLYLLGIEAPTQM